MTVIKSWNGTAWVSHSDWKRTKIWNGSAWVQVKPKFWTGVGWNVFSVPQTRTVTVGSLYDPGSKYAPAATSYGYNAGSFGSIDNNNLQLWENGVIIYLNWVDSFTQVLLQVNTNVPSNSGFTTLTINGTAFSRTAASYSTDNSTYASWAWASVATNPWSATGTNSTVTWT